MAGLDLQRESLITPVKSPIEDEIAVGRPAIGYRPNPDWLGPTRRAPAPKPPEQGDFRRGLGIAFDQAKQGVAGVRALGAETLGMEGARDEALKDYQEQGEAIAAKSKPTDSFTTALEGGIGDLIDWAQYGAGYVLGQAGMAAGSALAGGGFGAVASTLGRGAVTAGVKQLMASRIKDKITKGVTEEVALRSAFRELGAGVALGSFNLSQSLGHVYPEAVAEAEANGEDVSLLRVYAAGVLSAAVETATDALNLKKLGKAVTGKTPGADPSMLRRVATEAFVGGMREAGTELVQSGIERWGASKDLSSPEAIKEYIDSAALGFLGGAGFGTIKGAVTRPGEEDAAPPPAAAPELPELSGRLGANILVTPELREKHAEQLKATGLDPTSPDADAAIKALEAVERATGVIRTRIAEEERGKRQEEVTAAFGDTATSGVGVGVAESGLLTPRSAVTPDPEKRETVVNDPTATVPLPRVNWRGAEGGNPAVSPEDLVARQEGWEAVPAFPVEPDADLPAGIITQEGGKPIARNYFTARGPAERLASYVTDRYEQVVARVREGKRSKEAGGGRYFFVEIKPEEGFNWQLKPRSSLPGPEVPKLGTNGQDSTIVDVEASEVGATGGLPAPTGKLTGPAAAPATPAAAPATAATATAPPAPAAPAAAPAPSRSAGKPTGAWKGSQFEQRIQKVIDDLVGAGLEGDAKAVDIGLSADAANGKLTEAKVRLREAAARGKLAKAKPQQKAAPAAQGQETAEDRWRRMTTVERISAVAKAFPDRVQNGELNEVGKRLAGRSWASIGSAAKARIERAIMGEPEPAAKPAAKENPSAKPAESPVAQIVAETRERLRRRTNNPGYLLDVAPEPDSPEWKAAAEVAQRVFGRRLTPVKQGQRHLFNGLLTKEGEILLSVDSKKPVLAVLGHELLHAMRRENPALYDQFVRDLVKNARDLSSLREHLDEGYRQAGMKALAQDKFLEEFSADVVGDFFTDPKFWQGLAKRDQTLFQRVADFVLEFLDNLYNTLLKQEEFRPFRTDRFIKDLAAARRLVVSAIGEYAAGRPPAEVGAQQDLFALDRELTDGESGDLLAESIRPRRNNPTMNWVIVNPFEARGVLRLPSFNARRAITKREFGEAVDAWRTGKVERNDYSPAAVRRLARALAAEVQWYAGYSPDSGVDWYRDKFQRAIDVLVDAEPTLQDPDARGLLTLLLAITSDGAEVQDNTNMAMAMYYGFLDTGSLVSAAPKTGKYKASITKNAKILDNLISAKGVSDTLKYLLQPRAVADIKAEMRAQGLENPASNYPNDVKLPRAAVYLGPKLGAFFANLMGETGYLTMDRWWNRTINRYRGYMAPSPSEQSIDRLRELLGEPDLSDEGVIEAATEIAKERDRKIKQDGNYESSDLEKLSTTVYKNAKTELNDSPENTADRAFQIAVAKSAQRMLRGRGMDLAVADIQATIWYFEKELFDKIGIRGRGRISYEEAARRWVRGRQRSAAQADLGDVRRGGDRADEARSGVQQDLFSLDGVGGRDGGRGRPARSLAPLPGAPSIQGASGPDPRLVEVAERYARERGIPLRRQAEYVEVDEQLAARIAGAYDAMRHDPQNPRVREAYQDLIRQTRDQYDALVAAGYEFTFFDSKNDPYQGNPWNAMRDLRANQRMAVYGTYDGYGTQGVTGAMVDNNPMLADTGLRWRDQGGVEHPVLANDLFRAVHDAFGHGLEGAGFRARDEENAWQAHVRLFTGPAVGAITSETRGQNSWLNYGPYGDRNRTAKLEDTVFAEQKTGLMPEWTWTDGRAPDAEDSLSVDRDATSVTATPGVNLKRLAGLLGPQLYGDMKKMPQVAVKEMFQNAFDATRGYMAKAKNGERGYVAVAIDSKANKITVADAGLGMTPKILGGPFLQIAGTNKEGDRNSGGFGIAKMQFLFGSKELEVYTLRDGVLSVLRSTGDQLMSAMDDASKRPQIQLYRGDEALRMFREQVRQAWAATGEARNGPDPESLTSGTVVSVTVPDGFVDPSTGETVKITTPDYGGEYTVLDKSPLFEDIKVGVGIDGKRWWGNQMGSEFDATRFTRVFDVKFAWGGASVYVGNDVDKYMWGENAHFLSNGLWQFSSVIKAGTTKIPRHMYVNISSKVKPEEAGYPFQLNRQGLTQAAYEDFGKVASYLGMLYQRDVLGESAKRMTNIQYLNEDGTREDTPDVNPPMTSGGLASTIDANAKVEVRDGNLVVNGKTVPVLSADEMAKSRIDLDEYKAPAGLIDVDRILFHDNTMIPEGLDRNVAPDELSKRPKVLFSEWARAKYGNRFDLVNYQVGDIFRRTKQLFMEVFADDAEFKSQVESLRSASIGIGYDTRYYGVHSKVPIHQILVNPAISFRDNAQKSAGQLWMTMLHEFAHLKVMRHDEEFNDAEEKIVGDLMFDQDAALIRRDIIELYQQNLDMLQDFRETFRYVSVHSLAEPAGRSLVSGSEVKFRPVAGGAARNAGADADLAPATRGAAGRAAGGRGGDLDGGEGFDDGGADGDSLSIARPANIERDGWDERTRRALNDPFVPAAKQTIGQRLAGLRKDFLRRFVAAVADPFVGLKSLDDRLYMRARLTNGTDGVLEALLHFGQVFDNGGALDVRKGTKGLLQALTPLGGEVEDFFRWVALNRAAGLKKQDRENYFTDESIALRDKLAEGKMADGRSRRAVYDAVLKDMNALNRSVLELARKQGLIDQAGFDRFSKDIWYVPFYRVAEEDGNEVSAYQAAAGLSGQQFSERLKGGTQRVDNLLGNVLRNWGGLLAAAQKNGVARDTMAHAVQLKAARKVRSGTAGAIRVMEDGREASYLVDDPLVADALLSINTAALNHPVLNVMGWFKRTLTGAVTIDPAFKIRNLIRDSIQAMSLADLPFNPIANVVRGMRATNDENRVSAIAGGGLFHGHYFGEDSLASKIDRLVKKGVDRRTILDDPVDAIRAIADGYNSVSDRMENANRVAVYDSLIAKGKSHLEAAYAARDLMDFSLQGRSTAVRMLAMTLPFFNARLQGLYKLGRDGVAPTILTIMGKADEGQRAQAQRFATVAGGVVLASLLLYLLYKDDDEFQKREGWDRDNFWWFRIGETAFRIPKPFEVGAIGTLAERALEQLVDENAGGKVFAKAMLDMLVNTFAFDPVPQMFRPALNVAQNLDTFTDRQIETMGMQQLSKSERWGVGTTEAAKMLSSANEAVAGVLGPLGERAVLSPVQIDYLARAYFGWLGATIMQSAGQLLKWGSPIESPSAKVDQVPVAGAFVRDLPGAASRYVSEFYKSSEEVSRKWQDIKFYQRLGMMDEARKLMEERGDVVRLRSMYAAAQRQIAAINAQMRRIQLSPDLGAEEKRERLDVLAERKHELAKRVELARRQYELTN